MGSEGGRNPPGERSGTARGIGPTGVSRRSPTTPAPNATGRAGNERSPRRTAIRVRGRRPMPAAVASPDRARGRRAGPSIPAAGLRVAPPRKTRSTIGSTRCRRGNLGLGRGHHVDVSASRTGALTKRRAGSHRLPTTSMQTPIQQGLVNAARRWKGRLTGLERRSRAIRSGVRAESVRSRTLTPGHSN